MYTALTGTVPGGSPAAAGSPNLSCRIPCATRSLPQLSTLGFRFETSRKLPPTLTRETTMRYDRARASLDRRATYIVSAYIAAAG